MCIAIIKPQGVRGPSKETLAQCFARNRDGAGFCYAQNNKIQLRKGFMTFLEFITEYQKCYQMFDLDNATVFIHFRIATHGGVSQGNCHPFPMANSFKKMQELQGTVLKGGHVAMHNGVLRIKASETASDTMHYLKNLHGLDYWGSKNVQKLIQLSSVGSKLAFLSTSGRYQYYGEWIKDNDIFYSNNGYVIYQSDMTFRNFKAPDVDVPRIDTPKKVIVKELPLPMDPILAPDYSALMAPSAVKPKCSQSCAACVFAMKCYDDHNTAASVPGYEECFRAGDSAEFSAEELQVLWDYPEFFKQDGSVDIDEIREAIEDAEIDNVYDNAIEIEG